MRRTAKSNRGLSGPGGFTASLMRFVNGVSSLLLSHFFENLSDKLITSEMQRSRVSILYIVNTCEIWAYIRGAIRLIGNCFGL